MAKIDHCNPGKYTGCLPIFNDMLPCEGWKSTHGGTQTIKIACLGSHHSYLREGDSSRRNDNISSKAEGDQTNFWSAVGKPTLASGWMFLTCCQSHIWEHLELPTTALQHRGNRRHKLNNKWIFQRGLSRRKKQVKKWQERGWFTLCFSYLGLQYWGNH